MNNNSFSSYKINNENNSHENSRIGKLQENLLMMGFDIIMINKIISIFKVQEEFDAINYLIKDEDGMWNHPFILKEINDEENLDSNIFSKPKVIINKVISKIKEPKDSISKKYISKSVNNEFNQNIFIVNDDICEVCGELKSFHRIKNYEINEIEKDYNNNSFDNKQNLFIFDDNINNNHKDILIDDDDKEVIKNDINFNFINYEEINDINVNNTYCEICLGELEKPVVIEKCRHKFCYECFNLYLVNLINTNNIEKIPCPKNDCFNKELSEIFFTKYISSQEYEKYCSFKFKNKIAKDSNKVICPFDNCNSYAVIKNPLENYDSNPAYIKSTLKCLNNHIFCSCGKKLHKNECFSDEKELNEYFKKEKIKRCPKCGFLIKKNRGCNHMTCGNPTCKYQFCWLCLNEYSPGHYDYGECKDMQFIDEDSFEYWLHENCPFLRYIYISILFILACLFLLIFFIIIPGLGLSLMSYIVFYDHDFDIEILTTYIFPFQYVKLLNCLTYIWLSIACQSIIYIMIILLFFFLSFILIFLIPALFIYMICGIIKCLFERNQIDDVNISLDILGNQKQSNEIELSNQIEDINNNN